jgi:Cu/Ag efflux protein CusF
MNVFAADKAAEAKPADAKPVQEKKVEEKKSGEEKKAHHRNHYRGEVKAVDAKAGTVTVSSGEKTFAADEKLLSGVKVGDKVSVKFTRKDSQLTATAITPAKDHQKNHHKKKDAGKAEEVKAEEKK